MTKVEPKKIHSKMQRLEEFAFVIARRFAREVRTQCSLSQAVKQNATGLEVVIGIIASILPVILLPPSHLFFFSLLLLARNCISLSFCSPLLIYLLNLSLFCHTLLFSQFDATKIVAAMTEDVAETGGKNDQVPLPLLFECINKLLATAEIRTLRSFAQASLPSTMVSIAKSFFHHEVDRPTRALSSVPPVAAAALPNLSSSISSPVSSPKVKRQSSSMMDEAGESGGLFAKSDDLLTVASVSKILSSLSSSTQIDFPSYSNSSPWRLLRQQTAVLLRLQ